MNSNKGTLITIIVILAVVLLGVVMWLVQTNGISGLTTSETASSTTETSEVNAVDTTTNIQADLDQIDAGSTTEELEQIDAEINSL